ncbi:hypothetical protein SLS55_001300 [Diplodia seriata]|uniref:Uncharacterized protein n=1 Tax=Diplodia seriata TaxID=420778 RepID=A0ABR3CWP4_9PEZI
MPPLPPLRPLPPQSSLLRPAWSVAAGQLPNRRRRGGPAAAAVARRWHSDSPAPGESPSPATGSNGSTDRPQRAAAVARFRTAKHLFRKDVNSQGDPSGPEGSDAGAIAGFVGENGVKPLKGVARRKPGGGPKGKTPKGKTPKGKTPKGKTPKGKKAKEKARPAQKQQEGGQLDNDKAMTRKEKERNYRREKQKARRAKKKLEESGVVLESIAKRLSRLQRLAQMTSPVPDAAERVGGPRIGAITRDTIMDDETWQRLKQDVSQIGREKTDVVEEVKVEADQHVGDGKLDEGTEPLEKKDRRVSYRPLDPRGLPKPAEEDRRVSYRPLARWKKEKPDPTSVRERLRDAIGRVQSTISAELEDHSQPSRYRRNVQPVTKSLHEQRLDELEALLVEASRRLTELKGYKPSDVDTSPTLGLSSNVPSEPTGKTSPGQDQTRKENLQEEATAETGKHTGDVAQPRRYLSRDPSRPLPHMTEQAIPSELYGLRESVSSGQPYPRVESKQKGRLSSLTEDILGDGPKEHPEQKGRLSSLTEDILGNGPKEHPPESSTGNAEESAEPSGNQTESLIDEVLTPTMTAHQKQQAPLYIELFPELAQGSPKAQPTPYQERPVPKLSLDLQTQNSERRSRLVGRKEWTTKRMQELYVKDIVVVQLSGLSRHLSETDIRRLVPQSSKYIEGWSDPDFIKVIPVRDEETLERLDQYYVLFRNARGARDFQEHVRKLHVTTKRHSTSSLLSALPPPPGFRDDHGVDVHAAMQSYTIGPPASDKIYCNIVPYPYTRELQQLLARGGYDPIVRQPSSSAGDASPPRSPQQHADAIAAMSDSSPITKVLLSFDNGPQPSIGELSRTIARDGKERGLPWAVVGGKPNSPDAVVRLNANHAKPDNSGVRKVAPRYIVTLETKAEAQRFVGRWHCSPFRFSVEGVYEDNEGPPRARAEVLW